jgi:hypothetical protein
MPYTASSPNLPSNVKAASSKQRAQWVEVWNSSYNAAKKDGKSDKEAEEIAFRNANGVLKKAQMGGHGMANLLSWESVKSHFAGKMKTEDGETFPAAAYAYVPDPNTPSTWKLRLWESPDKKETAHQVGAACAALSSGGFRGNKAAIPAKDMAAVKRKVRAAWKRQNTGKSDDEMPDAIKMTAHFSVVDPESGMVHRWGKLFEVGEYAGHQFSMSEDELATVPSTFQPFDLNLQHTNTILDGQLGRLEEVEVTDDHRELYGRVVIPVWLDEAIGDRAMTVSTEWVRASKQLDGLAIEIDPAVDDAVLMKAYRKHAEPGSESEEKTEETRTADLAKIDAVLSLPLPGLDQPIVESLIVAFKDAVSGRHDTYSGQDAIQMVHDTAARYGAECKDPNKADMHSAHEITALQAMHDMAADHGAKCASLAKSSYNAPWMFSKAPRVHGEEEKEQGMANVTWDDVKTFFAGMKDDPTKTDPKPDATHDPKPESVKFAEQEIARLRAERDKAANENVRLRQERIQEQAVLFAEAQIREGKAVPAEKEGIVEAYIQAATDDLSGPVKMADGTEGTRVKKLEVLFSQKPKFSLVDERMTEVVHGALVNLAQTKRDEIDGTDPASIKALAESTSMGKTLMSANGTQN